MEDEKYTAFRQRIEELESHFNVEVVDDDITPQQEDLVRAFRLLCHAEIENYIEELAITLLNEGMAYWNEHKLANYNIASLFINSDKIDKNFDVVQKSCQLFADFRKVIKNNHGIKEENIKKLFFPLGYLIDDFDTTFINNLSSFGVSRGLTAHTSAGSQIQQALNFRDEKSKVQNIVAELVQFKNVLYSKM